MLFSFIRDLVPRGSVLNFVNKSTHSNIIGYHNIISIMFSNFISIFTSLIHKLICRLNSSTQAVPIFHNTI